MKDFGLLLTLMTPLMLSVSTAFGADSMDIHWKTLDRRLEISAPFNGRDIEIGISSRVGGAIDKISLGGKELVDSSDHGREFQFAASFNNEGECYNPTEAGSLDDGASDHSTSSLVFLQSNKTSLETRSQLAFWKSSDIACEQKFGIKLPALSEFFLHKTVTLGYVGFKNAIYIKEELKVPQDFAIGHFEILTGYTPIDFDSFWSLNLQNGSFSQLAAGVQQPSPIILSTKDERYAMGAIRLTNKNKGSLEFTYGVFAFTQGKNPTAKWNIFAHGNDIHSGSLEFSAVVFVGSLEEVKRSMLRFIRR